MNYHHLLSLSEYPLLNPRIDGWKKLQEVNARIVDIFVFPLPVFQYFLDNKRLPEDFVTEVVEAAQKIITDSPSHTALVRRAFVVPGLENPPGPRFLGLTTPKEVIQAIIDLFQFAIDQKYSEVDNSQISGWIEPPSTVLDASHSLIPYGGYGVSEDGHVTIYSLFGLNESVQSLVADKYEIEFRRGKGFIQRKEIPQKNLMLCTTPGVPAKLFPVPVDLQFDQVLSDAEIAEVARVVYELSQKYSPQRVEFSTDKNGLCFNEVADYWKEAKVAKPENFKIRGQVYNINSLADFQKLSTLPPSDILSGKIIVKVGENIIVNRDYDVLNTLTTWKNSLYVLYPGVVATQHAMRVLTDKGHKAFLIGTQKFAEGDEAQIVVSAGKVRITNLSKTQNQKYVSLWDASIIGVEFCGGKAENLSKLKILGFQVPHGSVLTTSLYDDIIAKLGFSLPIPLEQFQEVYLKLAHPSKEILNLINPLLHDYQQSGKNFSVRSSATIEDASEDSMAGMFDTCLNVSGQDLSKKVLAVVSSTFTPQIIQHLRATNPSLASKLKMAVVIQEMVKARCAGVIFGAKAQTRDLDIVEIEANQGLGDGIVSGQAKHIEQYIFSRSEHRTINHKGLGILSLVEAKALFMLSERLRSEFGDVPQDIEWAIDDQGQIWVLQSRDLYLGP